MYLQHLSDDQLEQYILGRACAEQAKVLEIHILTCAECLSRLEVLESNISLLKAALWHVKANAKRSNVQPSSPSILPFPSRKPANNRIGPA